MSRFRSFLMPVYSTPARQLLDTFYLSRFMNFRILIWFFWDPWLCVWAFFSPNPKHIKMIVLRAVKEFTSCTSIKQTLFEQIVTGDEVLALVHLFLLKKLLCICTIGFCDQASSWSSSCGWIEELCSQQPSLLVIEVAYWDPYNWLVTNLGIVQVSLQNKSNWVLG